MHTCSGLMGSSLIPFPSFSSIPVPFLLSNLFSRPSLSFLSLSSLQSLFMSCPSLQSLFPSFSPFPLFSFSLISFPVLLYNPFPFLLFNPCSYPSLQSLFPVLLSIPFFLSFFPFPFPYLLIILFNIECPKTPWGHKTANMITNIAVRLSFLIQICCSGLY